MKISIRWVELAAALLVILTGGIAGAEERFELANGLTLYGDIVPLMEKIAPKVDAFAAVWAQDPEAVIFGGAPRDLFYYVLKQFQPATDRRKIEMIKEGLLRRESIRTREFMVAESDLDVATRQTLNVDGKPFNLEKIQPIFIDRLDPRTHYGRNEVDQGYLPAEKVAMNAKGFVTLPQFKSGIEELFTGHFTFELPPPEIYWNTYYVKKHLNHPILLVVRHLRLLSMDEYNRYGDGVPRRSVDELIPRDQQRTIQEIIDRCLDGRELEPYLATGIFAKWLNGPIRKAFRAHANPTLANTLMHHFGIPKLAKKYSAIKFVNNYLFAKTRDREAIQRHLADFGVNEKDFFLPAKEAFPRLKGFHGTEEWIFNAIMIEGVLHSKSGTYGAGFYCVNEKNMYLAKLFSRGTDNIVEATFREDAKIVNVAGREGERVLNLFSRSPVYLKMQRESATRGSVYDDFADYFGIDAIHDGSEFAVKNSLVIESTTGAFKRVLTYPKALEIAPTISNAGEFRRFLQDLGVSRLSYGETREIVGRIPIDLYVDNIVGERLFRGLQAPAAITLVEMTIDKVNLARLYREARAVLPRKVYVETLAGTTGVLSELSDDLLLDVVGEFKSADEIQALAPVLLQRLDNPVAFRMIGEYFAGPSGIRDAAFRALRASTRSKTRLAWTEALVADSPLDDLEAWVRPEQMFVALSWLKAGFRPRRAYRALESAARRFTVERSGQHQRILFDGRVIAGGGFRTKDADTIEYLQSLREVTETLISATDDPDVLRDALVKIPQLGFAPSDVAHRLAGLDVAARIAPLERPAARAIAFAFVEALISTRETLEVLEPARPELEALFSGYPEMLPVLFADATFRRWFRLERVREFPMRDRAGATELTAHPTALVRLLAAVQLLDDGHDPRPNLEVALQLLRRGRFERLEFLLEDQSPLELGDFEWMLETMVRELKKLPESDRALKSGLGSLPPLHLSLEMTAFGSRYEIMRVAAILGEDVGDDAKMLETLAPIVLDPAQPRNFKLAAARALRQLEIGHPGKVELESQLKWRFVRAQRRWLWFSKPHSPTDFFRDRQGLAANLFRLWRSRDADFIAYLLEIAEGRGGAEIVPAHLADILVDLDLRDVRFAPFFVRHLSKTGAKGMPHLFATFLRLFPGRTKDISNALYVVHTVPEFFGPYLHELTSVAEHDPDVIRALREMRLTKMVAVKKQVLVAGQWLDDWLAQAVERRRSACANALVAVDEGEAS